MRAGALCQTRSCIEFDRRFKGASRLMTRFGADRYTFTIEFQSRGFEIALNRCPIDSHVIDRFTGDVSSDVRRMR